MSQVFVTTHSDHINIDGLICLMSFNVLTLQLCIDKRFLIKNNKKTWLIVLMKETLF